MQTCRTMSAIGSSIFLTFGMLAAPCDAGQSLRLEPVGAYHSGVFDGGAAEVIAYHAGTKTIYAVNTHDNRIDMVSLADPAHPRRTGSVSLASFGSLPTSVAAHEQVIATSVLSHDGTTPGRVLFFTPTGEILGAVSIGWHPDMVMFTPDGKYLLVANEGEPTADGKVDGEGSVSVVTIPTTWDAALTGLVVRDAHFREWNNKPVPAGVHVVNASIPFSQDVEPEGLAVSADSRTAYVSLQENNAIGIVDIATARVTQLFGLGYKDHSVTGNELDTSGRELADHIVACPVQGMYQPDNVGWVQANGQTYLVLADEGDARGNDSFEEAVFLKDAKLDPARFPQAAAWQAQDQFGNLQVSVTGDTDGDGDLDELYAFGSRSLSIVTLDGQLVYDSGSQLERMIAARLTRYAASHPEVESKYKVKRGPEPEGLAIGSLAGHTYVFLGLERDNGIVTFDISDPAHVEIVDYVHPTDFEGHAADVASDIGPEGLVFIPAEESPNGQPLLAVANEVSGSVTIYAVRAANWQTAAR